MTDEAFTMTIEEVKSPVASDATFTPVNKRT